MKAVTILLQGFGRAIVISEGTVELPLMLGTYSTSVVILAIFLVIKMPMTYNVIYGQSLLNVIGVVPSTYHQVMKFPTNWGVRCIKVINPLQENVMYTAYKLRALYQS